MIGIHLKNARPQRYETTYPPEWVNYYSKNNLILFDPLIAWGLTSTGYIRWSDISTLHSDPLCVMRKAAEHGLCFGLGISIGGPESRTLGGIANRDREFSDLEAEEIFEIVSELHKALNGTCSLTDAQREALEEIASGRTYDQACENLRISRTALRLRLERARHALGANSNKTAILSAYEKGIISTPADLSASTGMAFPPRPLSPKR